MNNSILTELKDYLASNGWSLESDYEINNDSNHLIEASINPDTWVIKVNFRKDFENEVKKIVNEPLVIECFDPIVGTKLVKAVTTHEIGHYKHCPRNNHNLARILNGVSKAINESSPKSRNNLLSNKFSIANMFMDVVDNATCSIELNKDFFNDGQTFFYISEGYLTKQSGSKLDPYYALFSGINVNLIQPDLCKRKSLYQYFPDLDKGLISEGVEIFIGREAIDFSDMEMMAESLISLYDESSFGQKAYEFTRLMIPLLEDKINLDKQLDSNYLVDRYQKDAEFQKVIKRLMVEEGEPSDFLGHSNNDFIEGKEYLDLKYWLMASESLINFNIENLSELDIIYYGEEEWKGDFSRLDFVNIKPTKDGFVFQQEAVAEPLTIREKGDFDFPDILYLFDTSGSMKGNRYELLLRAIYGSLYYLDETGKAADMWFNLTSFSTYTNSSDWFDYHSLEQKRKELLLSPSYGGTSLNSMVIRTIFDNARGPFHTILVTDGYISNEAEITQLFQQELDNGSSLDYISISDYNGEFMKLAENHQNAKCSIILKEEDIVDLIIGITKKIF